MNSALAQTSTVPLPHTRTHERALQWLGPAGFVVSAFFHVLLLIALLSAVQVNRRNARPFAPSQARAITLMLDPQPLAPVTPPVPAKPKEYLRPPTPLPARKQATQHKQVLAASAAPPSPQVSDEVEEMEDILGRIHDNWLEPPGSTSFHCRLRIDYAAGGMITAVRYLQGCGSLVLDDSVKRAIWKTQSLPLLRAKEKAGSLEIDFTP